MKKAIITGVFGQDGSYLCELLVNKGYEVHGIIRDKSSTNSVRIKQHLSSKSTSLTIHCCDIYNYNELIKVIKYIDPHEIYHLAAKHFSSEKSTNENDRLLYKDNITATFNILSAVKEYKSNIKIILAGSCLMFDGSNITPQNEMTPYETISFYGLAKITELELAVFFRNLGLFVCVAILYNHESPRRSPNFVTKKIVSNMVKIYRGEQEYFNLGNLDAIKDWGYAKDYVYGLWLMTKIDKPMDFILATGISRTIKDFIHAVSKKLRFDDWRNCVVVNKEIIKRNVKTQLIGDASQAKKELGWAPCISFYDMVGLMVECELSGSLD
jgi:GDPmannose 4,6-dehydratase